MKSLNEVKRKKKKKKKKISLLTLFISECGPGSVFKISSIGRLKGHLSPLE